MREQHHFRNELLVGLRHGDTSEQLLQIVGQVGTSCVSGVHGDEDTRVLVHFQSSPHKLNLGFLFLAVFQPNLDILDLLGNGRKNTFLQTVKFIKATPSTNLTDTEEDSAHGLEIECVVTAKDERETTKLETQCFNRLSLTSTSRTVGRTTKFLTQGLGKREEAAVSKRSADETFRNTQIFKTVAEFGVRHVNMQALEEIAFGLVDIAHLE